MRDENNIREVAALAPDYMGFIFYRKSPRYVGDDFKMPVLPANVKKVGVFVNAATDDMKAEADLHKLDYLQLHGEESVKQCEDLKNGGIKIIKVFSVDDDTDFEKTKPYQGIVDYFLFDSKGKFYGGNARPFDWNLLKKYDQLVPFFIGGGVAPENAPDIKKLAGMNLHAIDANSGVEVSPGLKNVKRVSALKDILSADS
jgi:phosphoribosylanthranilate isomerase